MNRILLIEDDEFYRKSISSVILSLGWACYGLSGHGNLNDAVEAFSPEVVIIDLLLGDSLDGKQVADHLHAEFPNLPLVLVTGYVISDAQRASLLKVFTSIIDKPFRSNHFIGELTRAIPANSLAQHSPNAHLGPSQGRNE